MYVFISFIFGCFGYLILYKYCIPLLFYSKTIHFDYTYQNPISIINFNDISLKYANLLGFDSINNKRLILPENYYYDINILLNIPNNKFFIDNTMIQLSLFSCTNNFTNHAVLSKKNNEYETYKFINDNNFKLLHKISKQVVIKYDNTLIYYIKSVILLIPHLLNIIDQTRNIHVKLTNDNLYFNTNNNELCFGLIELSNNKLTIYSGDIRFNIKLHGLKYYIYNYSLLSSFFSITLLSFTTFICCIPCCLFCCFKLDDFKTDNDDGLLNDNIMDTINDINNDNDIINDNIPDVIDDDNQGILRDGIRKRNINTKKVE